ncbi:hypothetical protein CB0940_07823 [Cercospora beticola]|uniref:Procollagen galactosyltransferase 1 n=1 Tax=Cercospora beticola TaxID=122368 RepID=A0A2G5H9H1_CERBT|nr:hypothetical protein CB0940_07823 [Cercospora beticola]PIA89171.1 hypothetical protein CB0940_07823 [Cercospora beticola]WPB03792.1 hypothetical protein RHO25_008436 [Cercospora beticola]CAK1357441.1 unnamed protein product [Cercospora beticola]
MTSLSAPLLPMKAEEDASKLNMVPAFLANPSTTFTKKTIHGEKLYNDILNQTLGFEKLYSIIMPSRTDLRDSLQLAAALTDLKIDIVDGKTAPQDPKAFPPHADDFGTNNSAIGAWRAHMDVLRMIVEQNISSAVVMESDVDWDYRIKQQMQGFARASRLLQQPEAHNSWFEDGDRLIHPLPTITPYGDDWDLLWLGHCGMDLPSPDGHIPIGRAAYHDITVPPIEKMKLRGKFKNELKDAYGECTRIVSHTADPLCSIAYAVSQRGARKLVYEMGVHKLDAAADLMFAWACDGVHGRKMHNCLTVNPQIFNQHRAAGPMSKASNIQHYTGKIRHSSTENVMYGTKVNFEALVNGRPEKEFVEYGHDWSREDAEAKKAEAEKEKKKHEKTGQ